MILLIDAPFDRWFDINNITPHFEFGFGLSYTTFGYSGLTVTKIHHRRESDKHTTPAVTSGSVALSIQSSNASVSASASASTITASTPNSSSVSISGK
jgi:hypothetical protein